MPGITSLPSSGFCKEPESRDPGAAARGCWTAEMHCCAGFLLTALTGAMLTLHPPARASYFSVTVRSGARASLDLPVPQQHGTAMNAGDPGKGAQWLERAERPDAALSRTEPGTEPPQDGLTEAVEDVVKVIEIVVALLYLGLVVHCVVDESVGVSHRAGAKKRDKRAGGSQAEQPPSLGQACRTSSWLGGSPCHSVPPVSCPTHNHWARLQPAKVELEVGGNGGGPSLSSQASLEHLPMCPSFDPVAPLGGDPACHTPGLYSSVRTHVAIVKVRGPCHQRASEARLGLESPSLLGPRTPTGGLERALGHDGEHRRGLWVRPSAGYTPGSLVTYLSVLRDTWAGPKWTTQRQRILLISFCRGRKGRGGNGAGPQRYHLALHPSPLQPSCDGHLFSLLQGPSLSWTVYLGWGLLWFWGGGGRVK